jgi:dephospho-CoA kinase
LRPLLRVGLTGGIASGKTTVAGLLAELGAFVIDADQLAHEAIEPHGACHAAVLERFGTDLLDGAGRIVRARLARRVFQDAAARAALNAIVHPAVMAEAERRIAAYAPEGHAPLVVFDAALLVETGLYRGFHRLIVCRCSRATQLRRLLARGATSREEAEARLAAQAPLDEKLARADYVIDTEGTLRETRRQTARVHAALVLDFEQEFGPPGA